MGWLFGVVGTRSLPIRGKSGAKAVAVPLGNSKSTFDKKKSRLLSANALTATGQALSVGCIKPYSSSFRA